MEKQNKLVTETKDMQSFFIDFFLKLKDAFHKSFQNSSNIGIYFSMKQKLRDLHTHQKYGEYDSSLFLMSPTLYEGLFENIRNNFNGDQASLIKQLINSSSVRRNFFCCMFQSKADQLLAFYDKNKLNIYSLSQLFKTNCIKQKPCMIKLNSIPISYLALSLTNNLIREDLLAVVGLKECQILQISPSGLLKQHM